MGGSTLALLGVSAEDTCFAELVTQVLAFVFTLEPVLH